jgi:hypothetical protein
MTSYEDAFKNLTSFRDSLPETGIKFLFFYASDMTKPKVKDTFRTWNTTNQTHYVLKGVTPNITYVFRESVIKYTVSSMIRSLKPYEHNVVIDSRTTQGDVNHGDHLDFAIIRKRDGSILVKSHFTFYHDYADNFNFTRSSKECNFILNEPKTTKALDEFVRQTYCEDISGPTQITMELMYSDSNVRDIVHRLTNVLLGRTLSGGGKPKRKYVLHKRKRYLVKRGLNGRKYIATPAGHVYLQKGGTGYKGITFFNDRFITFLTEWILQPVANLRSDLSTIQVIFDEENDVCQDGNTTIVIFYDFIEYTRNVFSVDAKMAIVACYAEEQISKGNANNLTEYERSCAQQIKQITGSIARRVQEVDFIANQ